jgi:hypothetical protein
MLDRLIASLCRACEKIITIVPGVFAVAMTVNRANEIEVFHISAMESYEWFQLQVEIDAKLDAGLASALFRAVGKCLNIAYQEAPEPGLNPVLAIQVLQTPGQPVHVRVPYEPLPDGTIRFMQGRLVANSEGDALH